MNGDQSKVKVVFKKIFKFIYKVLFIFGVCIFIFIILNAVLPFFGIYLI